MCGVETPRNSPTQKYCPPCAAKRLPNQKNYRKNGKQCKQCGEQIDPGTNGKRIYCPSCDPRTPPEHVQDFNPHYTETFYENENPRRKLRHMALAVGAKIRFDRNRREYEIMFNRNLSESLKNAGIDVIRLELHKSGNLALECDTALSLPQLAALLLNLGYETKAHLPGDHYKLLIERVDYE